MRTNLAFDLSSSRSYDSDGRLRVSDCRISAARVNSYLGSELMGADGAQGLDIDPNEIYPVYRSASALRAAVPTFEGVPLLIDHAATSATDPKKQLIVGSVSRVRWSAPYLVADLMILDAEAIRGIEDNTKRELSPGYRFTIADAPGTAPDGVPYRFKMTSVTGNHLSLVVEARTGRDILVADASPFDIDVDIDIDHKHVIPGYFRLGGPRY